MAVKENEGGGGGNGAPNPGTPPTPETLTDIETDCKKAFRAWVKTPSKANREKLSVFMDNFRGRWMAENFE